MIVFWTRSADNPASGIRLPIDECQKELFPDEILAPLPEKDRTEKPRQSRTKMPRGKYVLDRLPDEVRERNPDGIQKDWRNVDTRVFRYYTRIPMQRILVGLRRHVYQDAEGRYPVAALPPEIMGKASTERVSHVVANKFVYHMFNERTREQLAHAGHAISSSTLSDWIQRGAQKVLPLLQPLRVRILAGQYIQADETTILVRDREKSRHLGKHHQGYYWVHSDPVAKLGLFDYQKGRSREMVPPPFWRGLKETCRPMAMPYTTTLDAPARSRSTGAWPMPAEGSTRQKKAGRKFAMILIKSGFRGNSSPFCLNNSIYLPVLVSFLSYLTCFPLFITGLLFRPPL